MEGVLRTVVAQYDGSFYEEYSKGFLPHRCTGDERAK
jgi:hypothetical protein